MRLYQLSMSTESTQKNCRWPASMRPATAPIMLAVFKLVEAAAGGGKDQHRQARVAEDEQFHVAAEAGGIPLVILTVHVASARSGWS